MSRREQIESMLADNPSDTFLRYALAMELANDDETAEQCLDLHRGLMPVSYTHLTLPTTPYV